jgi:hypothetical protein
MIKLFRLDSERSGQDAGQRRPVRLLGSYVGSEWIVSFNLQHTTKSVAEAAIK